MARHARRSRRRLQVLSLVVLLFVLGFAAGLASSPRPARALSAPVPAPQAPTGLNKINHIIVIMQENRSFDHYFGTYPGADGIPKTAGGAFAASTCNFHPVLKKCLKPYHTSQDTNHGGPHSHGASNLDIAGGSMKGFIKGAASGPQSDPTRVCVEHPTLLKCKNFVGPQKQPDAMSFRIRADIPNYWAYADWGALQDRMFASVDSFSLPAHMFLVSAWSANCTSGPMSCKGSVAPDITKAFAWTDITYLLNQAGISWGYFVGNGTPVDKCYPGCQLDQLSATPPNWNPLPGFTTVKDNGELDHITHISEFEAALASDAIPQVSFIIPSAGQSEHPGKGSMRPGYAYVTTLVNEIAQSPVWSDSAIFITWDDWGGFYDHVNPPAAGDGLGYGIRVPGLVLGPYVKQGYIDHQTLAFEAYLKLIEDRFLGGQRIDDTDGRPDSRPAIPRENRSLLGDLVNDFDFNQTPRSPAAIILDP